VICPNCNRPALQLISLNGGPQGCYICTPPFPRNRSWHQIGCPVLRHIDIDQPWLCQAKLTSGKMDYGYQAAKRMAVQEEREACARLVEELKDKWDGCDNALNDAAAEIRKRGGSR